jgi:predicted nucleotide-binding protein
MDGWPAWAQDAREIADARVLAGLLTSLGEDGQTKSATAPLVEELGLTGIDPDHLAVRLVELGYFQKDSLTVTPGWDTLLITNHGREVARDFATARRKIKIAPAARTALLRWLYESGGDRRPNPDEILTTPFSWFYGTQFTSDQIAEAARNLRNRGFIDAIGTAQNDVLRLSLSPRGETCVESFDANPDALERPDTGSLQRIEHTVTSPTSGSTPASAEPLTIFLVHGRDNEFKWEVKNFIERIVDRTKVQVVILHEQANQGQTLLEKFEQYASTASYAVVLLTPDDVGGSVGDAQESRARQNVIFELGFFCGRLGRKHVAAINKGVEKPSDIDGFAYISHTGQWTDELRRELEVAGLTARP